MPRGIRLLAAVLALSALTAGAAHARPFHPRLDAAGVLDSLWHRLASRFVMVWAKAGGEMDPNGNTADGLTPPPDGEAGGQMDPNGVPGKAGGEMDPDG
jgi:hypothetical protein